jgi:phosphoglycerol transferase MdoB-like AlkP superfamily enzyme
VIVTFLVLAKMQLFRFTLFGGTQITSLLVDLMSALLITSLIELLVPKRFKTVAYGGYWLIASLTLLGAAVYFRYFGSVATYTSLFSVNQLPQVKSSIESLITPVEFLYLADGLIYVIGFLVAKALHYSKRNSPKVLIPSERKARPLSKTWLSLFVIMGLLLTIFTVRSATTTPNELKRAEMLGFPNYQLSVLWQALTTTKPEPSTIDMPALATEMVELRAQASLDTQAGSGIGKDTGNDSKLATNQLADADKAFGVHKGSNLVLVQLEATQNFVINLEVGGQEVTPVINQLLKESLYFPNVFQQIGQGNTSDAEFMSNTSIYPMATVPMSKEFSNRALPSLPKLLEEQGYTTMTLHANDVTFWDRDKMYPALGFDTYFDKPAFENDNFNSFGASDKELYRVGLTKLSAAAKKGKPFYAQFVSLSSHHPFKIPEEFQTLDLPEDLVGTELGDYLQALHYTDEALGTLIAGMKAEGLWDNTILAFYGDHFGLQVAQNDPLEVSAKLGIAYDSRLSRFNIPLVIHTPSNKQAVVERTGGQVDILPTLANLLGLNVNSDTFMAFGHDLLNIETNVIGMRYYLPTGSFFNDDILFVPGKGFEDGTAISLKTHEPVTDFAAYKKDYDYVLAWMKLSDEYVSQLPKR